jgi:Flp pilus assembly protein protease CpaA
VFASNGHLTSAAAVASGFRPATTVIATLSICGAVIALAIVARRRAETAVEVAAAA